MAGMLEGQTDYLRSTGIKDPRKKAKYAEAYRQGFIDAVVELARIGEEKDADALRNLKEEVEALS